MGIELLGEEIWLLVVAFIGISAWISLSLDEDDED